AAFAWANRSRTRDAPTPTIASTNSDAAPEKNGTFASPATARASSVLPVPGGPDSRTPCGMRAPSLRYLSGLRRKSTTSDSSCFASSIPATSANGTFSPLGSYSFARERPNCPSRPCTLPARRISQKRRNRKRSVGPNPSNRLSHHGGPVSSGTALTTTPFFCSSCESAFVSAKVGISVLKRVVGFESPDFCGFVKVPRTPVPFAGMIASGPPLRGDHRDVPVLHLGQEERAVWDPNPFRRLRRARGDPVVDDQEPDQPDEPPAPAEPGRRRFRQPRPARRVVRRGGLPWLRG